MKQPPLKTRFLGHPVVTTGASLVGAWLCWTLFQSGPEGVLLGFVVVAVVGHIIAANGEVTKYRAWKRAWDGMADGGGTARRRLVNPKRAAQLIVGATVLGYGVANLRDPEVQTGMAFIGAALTVWVMARLLRLGSPFRRAGRSAGGPVVTVAVTAPMIPVPTMPQAFAALPEHLWCLFGPAQ
jgi:hypothetical protein